jgi:glyoxylase-like metal-dependent hydrolase (beta-lactamase superfamily II)
MRPVAPGVFAIAGLKMGRSYLVEGAGGIALVDTSTAGAAPGILRAIDETGHRVEDLRAIVATHYHYDHTGNADALRDRSGAELCVHAADVPYVEGTTPWMAAPPPWGFMDRFGGEPYGLHVDRTLSDGDVLPFAGGLRVVHAPGHTPGHIALYAKEQRALFTGDALMNVLGLHLPMAMSTHDMAAARRSVFALAELDFDVALPGHGAPIIGHASEKIGEWTKAWLR